MLSSLDIFQVDNSALLCTYLMKNLGFMHCNFTLQHIGSRKLANLGLSKFLNLEDRLFERASEQVVFDFFVILIFSQPPQSLAYTHWRNVENRKQIYIYSSFNYVIFY